ncbi:hypothetical protein FRB93_004752 [Tulasnella sp. JGI-2019a]|nr:hypothetical protein FRB93_004752 [Tulasnella sp. JGI-2019a]
MSEGKAKSKKLTFKGDKKVKKRKRRDDDDEEHDNHGESSSADPQAWVKPEQELEVLGPTYIVHPSEPPICITYDSARGRVALHALPTDQNILDLTPTEISHVWVVTRIAGSQTINLRTADGKFLSCDAHGIVSCDREARGPQEEWTPVILPDGMVAFQNNYEKHLSVDEVAGGTLQLRGDSENVGFAERFHVKVQNEYKRKGVHSPIVFLSVLGLVPFLMFGGSLSGPMTWEKRVNDLYRMTSQTRQKFVITDESIYSAYAAGEEDRKKKEGEAVQKIDEAGSNAKFQTWGAGRSVVASDVSLVTNNEASSYRFISRDYLARSG